MNKDELLGNMKIIWGNLEARLARLSVDRTSIAHARRLIEAGKVQRTMGQARRLIMRSLRHRTPV